MKFDSITLDWQIIVKSRLKLYDQLRQLLPNNKPETREIAKGILEPLLSEVKQKENWSDVLSNQLGELILDDIFAWGPLTHIFKDKELEQVFVYSFAHIHCLWIDECVNQMLPFSLMFHTHQEIIAEIELKLGYELSFQNPIGIVPLNDSITIEAAYRDEFMYGKGFILRRNDPFGKLQGKSDLPFAKSLRKSIFATLNPSSELLKESSRIIPVLEHMIIANDIWEDENIEQFYERVLSQVLSPYQRQDKALGEFIENFMKGLGPLEWIISHPDFLSTTIRGRKEMKYRLKSQSADQPDLIFPFAFQQDRQILNIIERIIAPHGYRCDAKYPVNNFMTIDGYQIEIGVPHFLDEIFIRVSKT
jgi:Flp pilus assembly CpaF family ATPase